MRTSRVFTAMVIGAVLALAGCSSGDDNEGAADRADGWSDEAPQAAEEPGWDTGADGESGGADDNDSGGFVDEAPSAEEPGRDPGGEAPDVVEPPTSEDNFEDAGLVFITTGTVGVQVEDDPYDVVNEITRYIEGLGGGLVDRGFTAATEYQGASGYVTVKVPPRQVSTVIEELSTYGEVKSIDLHRQDISTQVSELESRIRVAELAVARMEGWLNEATTRDDAMELEQLYLERLVELEQLKSQREVNTHDTALSTLTIEVFSPEAAPPPPPEPEPEPETGFLAGLGTGWNAFYDWGSDALKVLGVLLPWLGFLILLAVAAYFLALPIRRWQASRPPRPVRQRPAPTYPAPMGGPVTYRTGPAGPQPGQPVQPWPQGPRGPQGPQGTTPPQLLDEQSAAPEGAEKPPAPPA